MERNTPPSSPEQSPYSAPGQPYNGPAQPQYGQPNGQPNVQPGGQAPYGAGYPQYQYGPPAGQPVQPGYGAPQGYPAYAPAAPAKKKGLPWWGWLLIGVPVLAIASCGLIFGLLLNAGISAKTDGEKVLNEFMQAAAARDIDKLYSLSAAGGDKEQFRREVETNFLQPTAGYVKDYESLAADNSFNFNSTNGRTTVELKGTVKYKGQGSGPFTATLQKVGDNWKVVEMNISAPGK